MEISSSYAHVVHKTGSLSNYDNDDNFKKQ